MKLITTVGTSIFSKHRKERNYKYLKDKSFAEWSEYEEEISELKKLVSKEINYQSDINFSAEIKSIVTIKRKLGDQAVEVYLIATDSILSVLSCELIHLYFEEHQEEGLSIKFDKRLQDRNGSIINGLQAYDYDKFKKGGIPNLLDFLYGSHVSNSGQYWDDISFNITGGYKVLIPIITIIAQVNKTRVFYIFEEDLDETNIAIPPLIELPVLPITINGMALEKFQEEFEKAEGGGEVELFNQEFKSIARPLLYEEDETIFLTGFGKLLYKELFPDTFTFYAESGIFQEIASNPDTVRVALKLASNQLRRAKTENKGGHLVFDDGNNPNRIFYFTSKKGDIYIYKVFSNKAEYKTYINSISCDEHFKHAYEQQSQPQKLLKP